MRIATGWRAAGTTKTNLPMSTPIIKGRGVVRNAAGTVTIAGVAQINTAMNAEVHDASVVWKMKDAQGKTQTLGITEEIKKVSCELIPGGTTATASTLAEAILQGAMPTKLSTLVLSGFAIADYNDTYVIEDDCPVKVNSDGAATVSVKGTKYERDFSAAALSA